jgi:imidazolonepropionase-like amidohydrolase
LTAAIAGGADVIVHTASNSGVWHAPLLKSMKDRGIALVPTLMLWRWETRHDAPSLVAEFVQAPVEQLRAFARAGGVVLFGTDVGYVDDYDPTEEYLLMAEAGLSARQILASLTTAPATRFGDASRLGRVAAGQIADLVVLAADPSGDVQAFANVRYTLKAGAIIYDASQEGGRRSP